MDETAQDQQRDRAVAVQQQVVRRTLGACVWLAMTASLAGSVSVLAQLSGAWSAVAVVVAVFACLPPLMAVIGTQRLARLTRSSRVLVPGPRRRVLLGLAPLLDRGPGSLALALRIVAGHTAVAVLVTVIVDSTRHATSSSLDPWPIFAVYPIVPVLAVIEWHTRMAVLASVDVASHE